MQGDYLTWAHFGWLLGLIATWSLVIIATARWAINSGLRGLGDRISSQEQQVRELFSGQEKKINGIVSGQEGKIAEVVEKHHALELAVANIRADLPLCYVRREDFIREEVTINTKLDRLRDLIAAAKNDGERENDA